MNAKGKKWLVSGIAVVVLVAAVTVGLVYGAAPTANTPDEKEQALLASARAELSQALPDGKLQPLADDALYEDALQETLISLKSDSYIYLFDEETQEPQGIVLAGGQEGVSLGDIASQQDAIAHATKLKETLFPEITNVDVTCRFTPGDPALSCPDQYNVEFLEKINDTVHGGKRISVILDGDGVLQTVATADTETLPPEDLEADTISDEEALGIAYAAVRKQCADPEWDGKGTFAPAKVTATQVIFDDGETESDDAGKDLSGISFGDPSKHQVTITREVKGGKQVVNVEIDKVLIESKYERCFQVQLDAATGEVVDVNFTR